MIYKLELSHIKSFVDKCSISLAPISIITGTNSSGKSTMFQALLLLKQAFEAPSGAFAGMHLNGRLVSIGAYDDWCSKHEREPFELALTIGPHPRHGGISKLITRHRPQRSVSLTRGRSWLDARWGSSLSPFTKVECTLVIQFQEAVGAPNSAELKRLDWHATLQLDGGVNSVYEIHIEHAGDSASPPPSPTLPDEPDPDQFRYLMTERRTTTPTVAVPPGQPLTSEPAWRCAVEGLMPTIVLEPTDTPQVLLTIVAAFRRAVRAFVSAGQATTERVAKGRFRAANHNVNPSSSSAELNRALHFLERSNDAQLCVFALSSAAFFLSNWLVGIPDPFEARPSADTRALQPKLAARYLQRLESLVGKPVEPSTQALDALKVITQTSPRLEPVVRYIARILDLITDIDELELLSGLLSRAALEAREQTMSFQPRTADPRRRLMQMAEETRAPTEEVVRRYLVDNLHHLGPLRDEPRNLYSTDPPQSAEDVGRRGERSISCLRLFGDTPVLAPDVTALGSTRPIHKMRLLKDAVVEWGRYIGIFDGLSIDSSKTKFGTVVNILSETDGATIHSDLTNVGVGVSQVLPVLLLVLAAPPGDTVLIEQPELHLHPSVQSRLAEFLALCALGARQLIIETHSEHLINRLRLMVAQTRLDPEADLAILFAERDHFGTSITRIPVHQDGSLERWPKGFFDEAEITLTDIIRSRLGGVE